MRKNENNNPIMHENKHNLAGVIIIAEPAKS
jgi:hypothetical protein